jgi:hypothetical protein
MTLTIVSAQLVNKVAVNVNFNVTCDTNADPGGDVPPDTNWAAIISFTLTQNIKGTIASNPAMTGGVGGIDPFESVTCDGTPQPVTVTLLPQNGTSPWYKAGPAYISNGVASTWDGDFDCGPVFTPCGSANFAGGININGGTQ